VKSNRPKKIILRTSRPFRNPEDRFQQLTAADLQLVVAGAYFVIDTLAPDKRRSTLRLLLEITAREAIINRKMNKWTEFVRDSRLRIDTTRGRGRPRDLLAAAELLDRKAALGKHAAKKLAQERNRTPGAIRIAFSRARKLLKMK
jgi:hypothetical protein